MSNYRQLLLLCVKALSTYDYNLYGIDDHLENFLHSSDCNVCVVNRLHHIAYILLVVWSCTLMSVV